MSGTINGSGFISHARHGARRQSQYAKHRRARAVGAGEQGAAAAARRSLCRLVHADHDRCVRDRGRRSRTTGCARSRSSSSPRPVRSSSPHRSRSSAASIARRSGSSSCATAARSSALRQCTPRSSTRRGRSPSASRASSAFASPGLRPRHGAAATRRRSRSASSHLLARVLVEAVKAEAVALPPQHQTRGERRGRGSPASWTATQVRVGARAFVVRPCDGGAAVATRSSSPARRCARTSSIDERLAAVLEYADELRPDLPMRARRRSRRAGIRRIVLLSGDHAPIAREVADAPGSRRRTAICCRETRRASSSGCAPKADVVMMVGDGTNDAPALVDRGRRHRARGAWRRHHRRSRGRDRARRCARPRRRSHGDRTPHDADRAAEHLGRTWG